MVSTETELKLIAAAAIIGFKSGPPNIYNSPAATGMPIVLYPNAQNKFCFIFFIVSWLNLIISSVLYFL